MKKKLYIIVFLFLFSLCSCSSDTIVYSEEYMFGQDQQYSFYDSFAGCPMAESQDGYYFMSGDTCQFLYYHDKITGATAPVCNKPECLHDDESCNAYLGHILALKYYSNKLYYCIDGLFNILGSNQTALCEVNIDGSGHKELLSFSESIYRMAIHRGYLYYATTDFGTISGKEDTTKTSMKLYRLPMKQLNKKPELLHEFSGINANIGPLLCYGNYLYYYHCYYTDALMEHVDSQLDRYNILDGTMTTISKGCTSRFTFFNGKLVITYPDGTYQCDLDGQNIYKIWDYEGAVLDGSEYLLVDTIANIGVIRGELPRIIAVFDTKGNVIGSIELDKSYFTPIGVVEESYLLFMNDGDTGNLIIFQIPLAQISEGVAEPDVFFKYTSER